MDGVTILGNFSFIVTGACINDIAVYLRYLLAKSLLLGYIGESWPLNQIMNKPEGQISDVMIHQYIPTVTICRGNIAIIIKS